MKLGGAGPPLARFVRHQGEEGHGSGQIEIGEFACNFPTWVADQVEKSIKAMLVVQGDYPDARRQRRGAAASGVVKHERILSCDVTVAGPA